MGLDPGTFQITFNILPLNSFVKFTLGSQIPLCESVTKKVNMSTEKNSNLIELTHLMFQQHFMSMCEPSKLN